MGIAKGSNLISDVKLGTTQVDKIYKGTDVVWQKPAPVTIRALKFTSNGSQTLGIDQSLIGELTPSFEYSNDGNTWSSWDITTTLSFGNGVDLYIRGMNTLISNATNYTHFIFSTNSLVECSGNIMHLFDYTQDLTSFSTSSGRGIAFLFNNCGCLTSAPSLPATTVQNYTYYYTFANCSSLELPPALPATSLGSYCYAFMFNGCSNLTTPPSLPALSLPSNAYNHMFTGCASLSSIPQFPATSLSSACYAYMFDGCKQIKVSETQTDEYMNVFSFGTDPSINSNRMFRGTSGTFTGTPSQTTYYTSNTIIQ